LISTYIIYNNINLFKEGFEDITSVTNPKKEPFPVDSIIYINLDSIFKEIELENGTLEQSDKYPIELKLRIASIKSGIHFLRSNRQVKTQQQ
jgi:hypothetical protein